MWLKNKNRMMDCIAILLFFVIPSLIYHDAIFRNDLMVYGDGMSSYAAKIFQYKEVAKGELPLWNSYVIAGSPFYAKSQNTFFYPFNALALFFPPTLFTNIYYILHIGFAGLFTYLFLKQTSGSRMTAFVGGIVFALSTCIGGFRKEHVTVFTSIIWLPLILYFLSLFIYHRKQRYLIFSAFAMMLQFFGGHPQFTFYSDIVAVAYLIYFMIVSKRAFLEILKSLLILGSAFILFSAIALVPLAELMLQSSRGAANYFSLFSPSWRLLLMLIFPKVFGDIFYPLGIYGSAEISIELYLGIIPLVYVLYAVRYYFNNHLIRFSIIAIFIAYLYASIPHIPYVRDVVQKIPILGYFGVQSRTLFIYVFFSIICFSYGVSDLNNPENLKRLNRHNFMMTILITLCALTIIAIGQSIPTEKPWSLFSLISSEVFSVSIVIALFNYLLVKSLSLFRYNQKFYAYASVTIGFILLFITGLDVGRFSSMRVETNYDTLLKTDETVSLKQLLQNEPYRILPIYDQYYEPVHNKSGLVDNWSLFNNIRNIKGWTEFENPHLNELFDQVETRDPTNIRRLISESGLISMLSVKYILSPIDQQFPKALPKIPESVLINRNSLIQIPGDGSLFVDSTPISLESKRYYRIELIVETPSTDIQEFFVDFYNGPEYDKIEQEKHFSLDSGEHTYKTVLYSGDDPLPQGGNSFRVH